MQSEKKSLRGRKGSYDAALRSSPARATRTVFLLFVVVVLAGLSTQFTQAFTTPVSQFSSRISVTRDQKGRMYQSDKDSEQGGEIEKNLASYSTPVNTGDDTPLGRLLRGAIQSGSSSELTKGSLVIAKADIPSMGIWMDQSYTLEQVVLQKTTEDGVVEKIPQESISGEVPAGYTQYITLYSPVYHKESGPVICTPEEVGLVSLQTEVVDSIIFALPVLAFWTATAFTFAKNYNDRYGGNFIDALFRT